MQGKKELEFQENGLLFREEHSEQKVSWEGIFTIRETGDHYFIYVSSVSGIIIPKTKLTLSDAEKEELHTMLTMKAGELS